MDAMPTLAEIEDVLYTPLAEGRQATPAAVRGDLGRGGEIDSLEGVELIVVAEEHFRIEIEDDELSSPLCRSVPRLANLVASKIAAGTPPGG